MATVEVIRKPVTKGGDPVINLIPVPRGQDGWEIAAKFMTSPEVTGVAVHGGSVFRGAASEVGEAGVAPSG